ncbi:MAG: branched-chain amino acid ABC transporter permease [Sulfolobales archaeon]
MDLSSLAVLISSILTYTSIYIILALSANLEYGYTGIPNFGKVFFFFVGAIVTAIIASTMYNSALGISDGFSAIAAAKRTEYSVQNPLFALEVFIACLVASTLASGVFGYLASYPALALREDFLAITLLVFGEAGRIFVRTYEPLVGGVYGMSGIPNPLNWLRDRATALLLYSLIVLIIAIVFFIVIERISNSPFGRVMKAVRDDELAASTLGKNVAMARGWVLFISSSMAGAAGSLFTFYTQSIFPDDYIPPVTFYVISMVLLGGAGNNVGTILGAIFLSLLDRFTQASFLALLGVTVSFDISFIRYAITGLIMILVIGFRPQGIIPEGVVKTPLYSIIRKRLYSGNKEQRGSQG